MDSLLCWELLQSHCEARGLCHWLTTIHMHFKKKCSLVLQPEKVCFVYQTVIFSLLHQHAQIARGRWTFFELCCHQGLLEKRHTVVDGLGGFTSSHPSLSPACSPSSISISLNDAQSLTWPKRKPQAPSWPLCLLTAPPKSCRVTPIFSFLSTSFGSGHQNFLSRWHQGLPNWSPSLQLYLKSEK